VYPVHLLTAVITIVLGFVLQAWFASDNRVAIPVNLALVQAWSRRPEFIFSLNPLFSLSDEAFFYAVFPLVIGWVVMRRRSPGTLVIGAGAYLLAVGALVRAAHNQAVPGSLTRCRSTGSGSFWWESALRSW